MDFTSYAAAVGGMGMVAFVAVVLAASTLLLHVMLALGVWHDGFRIKTRFVEPWVWSLAVLLSGLFGLLCYWGIHYSKLSDPAEPRTAEESSDDELREERRRRLHRRPFRPQPEERDDSPVADFDAEIVTCPACGSKFDHALERCPDCDLHFDPADQSEEPK